jgi:beta-galactosidase GanA
MKILPVFVSLFLSICSFAQSASKNSPHLQKQGSATQLIVNNNPFLILGGELGNSSASSLEYMRLIWPKLKQMHLNTVLTPVYWELMEPEENKFDFTLVDSTILNARKHNIKVVFLWFGSWKNSMSCYAPAWVKTAQKRFPRAQQQSGAGVEILSAFNANNLAADIKAFKTLMKHIKELDANDQTVIMIQVENEIGMLTEAREYTPEANAAFKSDVPSELMNHLQKNKEVLVPELKERWAANGYLIKGNWEKVFGKSLETDEIFQAYYYAKFTNAVAQAGKAEYALPMFVNAALNYKNVKPGDYPSAGPLPQIMDIWQAAAPAIDFLSPDFYNPYFRRYSDLYVRRNNPFFIPEIRFEPSTEAKVFYAIGHHNAMGFSPFSIESSDKPNEEPIAKSYQLIEQLTPQILQYQGTGKIEGALLDTQVRKQEMKMGKYILNVTHYTSLGWVPEAKRAEFPSAGGIIIQTGEDEFIIAGTGIVVTFATNDKENPIVGILQADEGEYINGKWVPGRRMNGDQDHQGRHVRIEYDDWGIQQVKLYRYK